MTDQEELTTDDELDQVQAREVQRRRQVLRRLGGAHGLVAVPDGGGRGGRTSLKAALRSWRFDHPDEDSDDAA